MGLDGDAAASIRQSLVEDYGLSGVPGSAFLLVSQEEGFLWTDAPADGVAPPPYQFSMAEVVRRYLPNLAPQQWLWGQDLQLMVVQWLHDLIGGAAVPGTEAEGAMVRSGLLSSLRGARVVEEVPV
jgi:hypothetical protein